MGVEGVRIGKEKNIFFEKERGDLVFRLMIQTPADRYGIFQIELELLKL